MTGRKHKILNCRDIGVYQLSAKRTWTWAKGVRYSTKRNLYETEHFDVHYKRKIGVADWKSRFVALYFELKSIHMLIVACFYYQMQSGLQYALQKMNGFEQSCSCSWWSRSQKHYFRAFCKRQRRQYSSFHIRCAWAKGCLLSTSH